jgi:hypothetical protein
MTASTTPLITDYLGGGPGRTSAGSPSRTSASGGYPARSPSSTVAWRWQPLTEATNNLVRIRQLWSTSIQPRSALLSSA